MIGGFLFPMISIGVMAGVVTYNFDYDMPLGLCVTCFMAAVPGGIAPLPLTMTGLACIFFYLGMQQTMPVFLAVTVSYTLVSGSGLLAALAGSSRPPADHVLNDDNDGGRKEEKPLDPPVEVSNEEKANAIQLDKQDRAGLLVEDVVQP